MSAQTQVDQEPETYLETLIRLINEESNTLREQRRPFTFDFSQHHFLSDDGVAKVIEHIEQTHGYEVDSDRSRPASMYYRFRPKQ